MCTVSKVTSLFRGFRVQDILDCIQRKARGVEGFARNLQDGLVVKNYLATKAVQKTTATTQVRAEEIYEGVSGMDQAVRGLDDRCQEIDSHIVELKDFISEQINDALASKNGMFQMLKEVVSGKQARPRSRAIAMLIPDSFSMRRAGAGAYDEAHMDHLFSEPVS